MKQGLFLLVLIVLSSTGIAAQGSELTVDKQNAIIFVRHALAPGTGDPDSFDIDDCSTQRNLSDQGRQQARDIGQKLHRLGVTDVPVYTSAWCRCVETAHLMRIGRGASQPLLNSFFASPSDGPAQLQGLRDWLSTVETPVVLVTHQVVITGMTEVYPTSGEMVITTLDDDGKLSVVSTIETSYR